MKDGEEALSQYDELAAALTEVGADWVVDEVQEVVALGKSVPFRDLSQDESRRYEQRLSEESNRGVAIRGAKAGDSIGVPYTLPERLDLLVQATERIIETLDRSQAYVADFAARFHVNAIVLEQPAGAGDTTGTPETRGIALSAPKSIEERLASLHSLLYGEVLD